MFLLVCDGQKISFITVWFRYLTGKINEGEAHNITCPGFDCTRLVPVDVIETLVPRDIARRYLQFDIKVRQLIRRRLRLIICD